MRRRLSATLPIAAILVVAAALRLYGLSFGLPHPQARPDETTALGHADAILRGNWNPHFFNWPTFALYLYAFAFAIARGAGAALTRTQEFLTARALVAAAGTATVPLTAAVARRAADRTAGLIAALFLAVAPLHVRESHFAMTDVVMTALLLTSMAVLMAARDGSRTWPYAAAGLAGGLATSTKYSAGIVLVLLAAAPSIATAGAFAGGWAAGFFGGTPFALFDFHAFAADVAYERAHLSGGHAVAMARGWIAHVRTTLPAGVGLAILVAGLCGLPLAAVRSGRRALVPLLFTLAFYLSIGAGRTVFFRYALPLVPMVCVFAAIAVCVAARWLAAQARLPAAAAITVVALATASPSLWQSVQLDRLLAREDSRVVAARWLAGQLRHDDTLYDSGGDYARLSWEPGVDFHEWRYDAARRAFGDPQGRTPGWILLYESPLPEYTAPPAGIRELVDARYQLVYRVDGVPASAGSGVYDRQDAFFLPIAGFTGIARPGPTVLMYRLRR
jgi:4-amino-4-deoxy-L-arabinose transferase-like glycosyltransferase